MSMEKVVHRIATDSSFATAFRDDPSAALRAYGMDLGHAEINAILKGMDSDSISKVSNNPTDWFVSQFAEATDNPTDWFETQFKLKGA